jgi:hypothetical protein
MAERVGFELSVTFRIPLRELGPSLAHFSVLKKKILNQREFPGFDSAFRISLIPFMHDVREDTSITSNIGRRPSVVADRAESLLVLRNHDACPRQNSSLGRDFPKLPILADLDSSLCCKLSLKAVAC